MNKDFNLLSLIQELELTESQRLALAKILLEIDLKGVCKSISHFKLSSSNRAKIAELAKLKDKDTTLVHLSTFSLDDKDILKIFKN